MFLDRKRGDNILDQMLAGISWNQLSFSFFMNTILTCEDCSKHLKSAPCFYVTTFSAFYSRAMNMYFVFHSFAPGGLYLLALHKASVFFFIVYCFHPVHQHLQLRPEAEVFRSISTHPGWLSLELRILKQNWKTMAINYLLFHSILSRNNVRQMFTSPDFKVSLKY